MIFHLCIAISSPSDHLKASHQMGHLFLLLLSLLLSTTHAFSHAKAAVTEDKSLSQSSVRAMIGSRPPSCEGRCRSCGHCEAVQVPVTPQDLQKKLGHGHGHGHDHGNEAGASSNHAAGARTMPSSYVDRSNYKPLSWRCKCGGMILNP